MAKMTETETKAKVIIEEEEEEEGEVIDEEKGFLQHDPPTNKPHKTVAGLSKKFWWSASINTAATIAIIFLNKQIFRVPSLRHAQVTFAAFHFATTALLLYTLSRPAIRLFDAKPVALARILPLALGMIFNVVLPNASLAYSSIQFYQVMRALVSPCVALLSYCLLGQKIPALAVATLAPMCVGVGVISYFDNPEARTTTVPLGVVFSVAGVLATSLYTVWIQKYHGVLECTSMQLLFNQAPVSVLLMLYLIPFSDDVTATGEVALGTWMLILLSGLLACLITVSQFIIIHEAGPVSSTVVGHFKTCSIILLSWISGGNSSKNGSFVGMVLAVGGIISYSVVTQRYARK